MTLNEALKHASKAHAYGLDCSYDEDQEALAVLYKAYVELAKEVHQLPLH